MTVWMAAAGIILPFGLGAVLASIIYKFLLPNLESNLGAFALFLGVALSITAFPVLARILTERKLLNTEVRPNPSHLCRFSRNLTLSAG